MGKCKNAAKGGRGTQKGASSTQLSHKGEQGDTGDTAQNLMEEVASMEEVSSLMGVPSKTPFRFTQLSRSSFKWSLSPEHPWDNWMTPKDQLWYCLHVRVTLGEEIGDQPPPSHTWNGLLIANILQEACQRDHITEAVILAPGEAILFFRRCSQNGGLLYCDTQDIEHGLMGSITWVRRTVQVEVTVNII